MAIDMKAKGVAVGVGVLDQYMEKLDAEKGRTEAWKTWKDYVRIAGAIGSLAGEMMMGGTIGGLCRDASSSFLTLITKSVMREVLKPKTTAKATTMYAPAGPVRAYQPVFPKPELY